MTDTVQVAVVPEADGEFEMTEREVFEPDLNWTARHEGTRFRLGEKSPE